MPLRRSLIFIARARDLEIGAGVLWGRARAGRAIYEMGKWQWNEGPKCEFGADPCYGHARTGAEARQVARVEHDQQDGRRETQGAAPLPQ